jgi:hypothetical protein
MEAHMGNKFADLWRWDVEIGRGPYAIIGVLGFAFKHNFDRMVAGLFGRP